ncbi:MAG TPA: helix-turn-helix transcriptional regulator, partial [Clostridia bacterium]|nr:helix-turn-helix transcriptional regulator [Clostridia bacterium]
MKKKGAHRSTGRGVLLRFALRYIAVLMAVALFMVPIYRQTLAVVSQSAISDSFDMLKEGFRIVDDELIKMRQLGTVMRSEQNFVSLVRLSDAQIKPADYYTMTAAQKFMTTVLLPSDAVIGAYFLFEANVLSISSERIYRTRDEMFHPYLTVYGKTGREWLDALFAQPGTALMPEVRLLFRQSMQNAGQIADAIAYVVVLNSGDFYLRSDSRLVYLLDTQWMLRLLAGGLVGKGSLLVLDAQGQVILNRNAEHLPLEFMETGVRSTRVEGEPTVILTIAESGSGLRVVAGIPESLFQERIRSVMDFMKLNLGLAVLCGLIVALVLAYRNGKPLNRLLSMAETLVRPAQNRENEYDYIGKALEKLSLINEGYRLEVETLDKAIQTNLFDKLLTKDADMAEEKERVQKYLPFVQAPFWIAALRLWRSEDLGDGHSAELAKVAAMDAIRAQARCEVFFHSILPGCVVACFSLAEGERPEDSRGELLCCAERVFNVTGLRLAIGISDAHQGHDTLRLAYTQALEAMRTAEVDSAPVAVYSRDRHTAAVLCEVEDIQRLHEALLAGDLPASQAVIEEVHRRCLAQGQLEEERIRRVYYGIQNTILFASRDPQMEGEVSQSDSGYAEIKTLEELFMQLRANAKRLCREVEHKKKSRNLKLREAVTDYILENHTDGRLCAASVSGHFKLSEKYLFSFVREQTGKSFGDYLADVRLEHAMSLLTKTEMSIAEIAEATGFNAPNTFYKVFRRRYGVSP